MKIAIAAELAPARTLIPVLEKLNAEIIGLAHGPGAEELLTPHCSQIYSIGQGRRAGARKRSNAQIASLVIKDILKTVRAIQGKGIDLMITCGNAGDVRKGLAAANLLRIPTLHIEQDIYNPIEMIAYADLVTAPSNEYREYLEKQYNLKNVKNIQGYPLAYYVHNMDLMAKNEAKDIYEVDGFVLVALGGDLKSEQLPKLVNAVKKLEKPVLIAPFRFDSEHVQNLVEASPNSNNVKVLEGYVNLPSIMLAADALIYGAGMGITLEAGVLEVPSLKIAGFHHKHASVDLAQKLGIKVVDISDIPREIINIPVPDGRGLVENAEKSIDNLVEIINSFDDLKKSKGGFKSFKKIWNARSQFR